MPSRTMFRSYFNRDSAPGSLFGRNRPDYQLSLTGFRQRILSLIRRGPQHFLNFGLRQIGGAAQPDETILTSIARKDSMRVGQRGAVVEGERDTLAIRN